MARSLRAEPKSAVFYLRAGHVDEPVWQWVERFLFEHVDTVVSDGHLAASERDDFASAWQRVRGTPGAVLFSPIQVTVIARRA
jgi:hypothetical protein